MQLHFAQPLWLPVGFVACVAALLFLRATARRRQQALQRFAAPHLLDRLTANVSGLRRRIKDILVILAVACVFIALARPQYGTRWVEVWRKGIDILIAVDTSRSMLTRDVKPDRLERAKLAIRDFVSRLQGDRVGLLPFAGTAFLMCPLTTDYDAFYSSLNSLDTNIIPTGGTNIAAAIRKAEQVLSNEANHKILILVTDGENLQGDALAAAREAKKKKLTIYTVGVGTPAGELIPLPGGKQGYLQDSSGKFVTSRLDEKMLTRIAEATGGLYVPLGTMGQGFDTIYRRKLALVPKEEHGQQMRRVPVERFAWPVAAALLLLTAEFLLPGRKPAWRLRLPMVRTAGRRSRKAAGPAMLLLALALLLQQPATARASRGEEAYRAGHYDKAAAFYDQRLKKDQQDPVLLFNRGDVAYKEKKYQQAVSLFNQVLASHDLDLQARAYYNRGNAQYRLGEAALKTDPGQAMELWQEALKSYASSLKLKKDDADARHNQELVKKRLAELRRKQKQKKRNNQQKNEKKEQNGKKGKKGGKKNTPGNRKQKKQDRGNGRQSSSNQQKGQEKKGGGPEKNRNGNKAGQKKQPAAGQKPGAGNKPATAGKKNKGSGRIEQRQKTAAKQSMNRNSGTGSMAMNREDRKRRAEGKMTREEAINLLNALKGDEGTLNFVPHSGGGRENQPGRNW